MTSFFGLPECVQAYILGILTPKELGILSTTKKSMNVLTERVAAIAVRYLQRNHFNGLVIEDLGMSNKLIMREMTRSRFLCIGGALSENSLVELSMPSGVWREFETEIPSPRESSEFVFSQGSIYSISGSHDSSSRTVDRFNTMKNDWTKCTPLPTNIRYSSCIPSDTKLYVIGGEKAETSSSTALIYSIGFDELAAGQNDWNVLDHALRAPRKGHASVLFHDKLWVAGGILRDEEITSSVEVLSFKSGLDCIETLPLDANPDNTFVEAASMTNKRRNFKLVVVEDKLYAVGGDDESTVEVYCEDSNIWQVTTRFPQSRQNFATSRVGSKIVLMGGQDRRRAAVRSIDAFDVCSGEWASSLLTGAHSAGLSKSVSNKDMIAAASAANIAANSSATARSSGSVQSKSPSVQQASVSQSEKMRRSISAPSILTLCAPPSGSVSTAGGGGGCVFTGEVKENDQPRAFADLAVTDLSLPRNIYPGGFMFGQAVLLDYGSLRWS